MSEQQRVAIVTGAAGGIGQEIVLGLLGRGSPWLRPTELPKVSLISRVQRSSANKAPT
jgi:NAD(P)-dependent dehydrogenase (short-subunit alcohol dehydrogenase family)